MKLKPSAIRILAVLADGLNHSAREFLNGDHGFYCTAVSQRVGELRRAGYRITSSGRGGHSLATYRLEVEA